MKMIVAIFRKKEKLVVCSYPEATEESTGRGQGYFKYS